MTREEAIQWLKWLIAERKVRVLISECEITEALDMAISALQEPQIVRCGECIRHGMNTCPMWEGCTTEDFMWCSEGEGVVK